MKKLNITAIVLSTALLLTSCGGASDEEIIEETGPSNALEALMNIEETAKELEDKIEEHQNTLEERKANGDTLAMHYEELMKLLPDAISGYTKGEPTGGTINAPGASYSTAEVKFTNDAGKDIKVTLVDYTAAYALYQGATAMWAMGMSVDTPTEKANGIKFNDNISGWEVYQKKSKNATLTLGIGSRFLLNIEAQEQDDTEFVKEIAKDMEIVDMSKM